MALKVFLALAAGLTFAACSTIAPPGDSPMDGRWTLNYSCARATGIYAERCAAGVRDFFSLDLWSRNGRLCGTHATSTQMLNHVDEGGDAEHPTIHGATHKAVATVNWEIFGETGMATLKLKGDKLVWKVTSADRRDNVWGGVPTDAVLLRRTANPNDQGHEWPCP